MKQIERVGNYSKCPYCGKLFGNGISIVYSEIVMGCTCEGMRNAVQMEKLIERVNNLEKQSYGKSN
jgi:hypothetical protein